MNKQSGPKRKEYAFISYYLWLLALPMIIGLGVIVVQFQLVYRTAQEQKLKVLNHAIALSEKETLYNVEQTMELLVASDRIRPLDQSNDSRDFYRKLWLEQTRLNLLIDTIFFADSNGQWFSTKQHMGRKLDPRSRPWFESALLHPNNIAWTLPYDDAFTQKKTMTISYAMMDSQASPLQRVLGVDLDLHEWSEKIATLAEGDNAMRHLVIDRKSGQIVLHTNPSLIGTELMQPWRPQLVGQSGTFFTQETGEDGGYVAYEALGNNANWLAITVQLHRDTFMQRQLTLILVILTCSSCLFIALALLFRQRLTGIIDSLILIVRQLRLSPDRGSLVLPPIPGFTDLNAEMNLVSSHLQENIKRASLDALTGLYNRRHLDETLARLQGQQTPIVLALVDLDHFKAINDSFGHALGDTALRRVAALGLESLGDRATLYRYGGEELVAIFEKDSLEDAEQQLECWRVAVAKAQWREESLIVTFSAGIGASEGRTMEALLEAVDQALYRAKEDGRNRIYRAQSGW